MDLIKSKFPLKKKSKALTYLFPASPCPCQPYESPFLDLLITPHLSLITEAMLCPFHCYLPIVGLVPPAALGIPPVSLISSVSLRCKLMLSIQKVHIPHI